MLSPPAPLCCKPGCQTLCAEPSCPLLLWTRLLYPVLCVHAPLQSERDALQWAAWEKQQKEINKLQEMAARLTGGAQSGRAAQVSGWHVVAARQCGT